MKELLEAAARKPRRYNQGSPVGSTRSIVRSSYFAIVIAGWNFRKGQFIPIAERAESFGVMATTRLKPDLENTRP
jgi:hypothetical protein